MFTACASAGDDPDAGVNPGADADPNAPDASFAIDAPLGTPDAGPQDDAMPTGTLTVVSPNGGGTYTGGDVVDVQWISTGTVGNVDVELHKNGIKVADVVTGTADDGSFSWNVAIDRAADIDYTIVVRASAAPSVSDESDTNFAVANWQYRVPVTFSSATAETNHAMLIELTTSNFTYANALADGADVRFATDATRSAGFDIPYYIESWNQAGTSRVWVLVPTLTAGASDTVHMFYGNPLAVTSTSDLSSTFPSQYISTDGATLNATYNVDLFRIVSSHSVSIPAGTAVTVNARWIVVAGTITGVGRGSVGGGTGGGTGTGLGGGSTNSGAGGAGYGGSGGLGGYDSGDTPGAGGSAYGSTTTVAIQMGSGGGGPTDVNGGSGGGAITLNGNLVDVSGAIDCDGGDGAWGSTTGRGSGGGSGGGILLVGHVVSATGTLLARGGDGGTDTSTASDGGGGGGGGGGRIKILYEGNVVNTASLSAIGGIGGNFGDVASGQPGNTGTTYVGTTAVGEPAVVVASEIALY